MNDASVCSMRLKPLCLSSRTLVLRLPRALAENNVKYSRMQAPLVMRLPHASADQHPQLGPNNAGDV